MDALRTTARVITQTTLVTAAVTERVTEALLRHAMDRADRLSEAHDGGTQRV